MNLPPDLMQQFFDANGNPLAGGKIYTYQAGTSTLQNTYTDQGGLTPNSNPIVLDSAGRCTMWLDPRLSYKFVITDSNDVTAKTIDNQIGLLTVDAVGTETIQDEAVTEPKLGDNAASSRVVASSASVDADRAITANHLKDAIVGAGKLAASAFPQNVPLNAGLAAAVALNDLTINLKDAAGNAPSASSPVKIPFRDSTASVGNTTIRSVTAALSLAVPSGATLGHTDGDVGYVYVYALDNAGTVELAVSGSRIWDEGKLQTSTTISTAADDLVTLYSSTGRSNVPIRYIGRLKSAQATAGTWATAISEISLSPSNRGNQARSYVRVGTGNGHGSTATKIRRFSNTVANVGTAITYVDSATSGASFTINEDGVYGIQYWERRNGATESVAISLNSTTLTTSAHLLTAAEYLAANHCSTAVVTSCSAIIYLHAGDIVRPHTEGSADSSDAWGAGFAITQITKDI